MSNQAEAYEELSAALEALPQTPENRIKRSRMADQLDVMTFRASLEADFTSGEVRDWIAVYTRHSGKIIVETYHGYNNMAETMLSRKEARELRDLLNSLKLND